MFARTIRCPVCGGSNCRRSQSGWVRHLTRLTFLFPLRCRHCETRFWRLTLAPPPFGRPRRHGSIRPGHGSDVVLQNADGSGALPAPG